MGSDLAQALASPFTEAVRYCTSLSSESDCESMCCTCHTKTTARDSDDEELSVEDKPT